MIRSTSMLRGLDLPGLVLGLLLGVHGVALAAATADEGGDFRDPMQAPAPASARADAAPGSTSPSHAGDAVRHLMVIGGRRYVIDGGQRLGVGDRLGEARIERIDDGAVWLRDAQGLRQVSLFGGIVKRPAQARDGAAASAARTPRRSGSATARAPRSAPTVPSADTSARSQALAQVPTTPVSSSTR